MVDLTLVEEHQILVFKPVIEWKEMKKNKVISVCKVLKSLY